MLNRHQVVMAAGCCLFGLLPLAATGADEPSGERAERCVQLSRIARTEVIDDQNILFYMRGDEIYRNQLPHRCPGLRHERTFMYRTSLSQLCDVDIITVLYNHGFGFTPGASCGLGRFQPITKDEINALKEAPRDIESEEVAPAEPEELGESD